MHSISRIFVGVVIGLCLLTVSTIAFAKDIMMTVPVKQVVEKIDKNGAPYKRIVFTQDAELNGVKYQKSAIMMVFADQIDMIADLKAGDQLKCIASTSEYKGRTSYTLQAVIE